MFDRHRERGSRGNHRWRFHAGRRLVCCFTAAATVAIIGCGRPDWHKLYSEADEKFRSGDSDAALTLVDRDSQSSETGDPVRYWQFRTLKAEILLRQGHPKEAQALLEQPVSSNSPREITLRKYLVQAQALCRLKKVADADRLFDQAAELIRPDEAKLRAELELNLGYCAFPRDRDLARRHFEASAKSAHRVDQYGEARAFGAAGFALMQDGHYDEAIEKLLAASSLTNSAWLRESLFGDLGECYQQLGDWKTAISYSQQAEDLASNIKDAATDRVRWLIDLGREHYSQIEYSEAEKAWSTALALAESSANTDLKGRSLINLAMLALKRGDESRAEDYLKKGEQLQLEEAQQLYLLLYKARLAELKQNPADAEALLVKILSAKPNPQVRYEAETELASLYVAQRRFAAADTMFREGISTAERAFAAIGNDQFRISFSDYMPFYHKYVAFLISQKRAWDALAVAERGRSRALAVALGLGTMTKGLNLRRIQRNLRSTGQVVLAYWLSPEASYVWVVTSSQMKLLQLPPEMNIVKAVDAYSQQVLDLSAPEESGLGQTLYEILVAPAERYLPRGSKVIIVPHERLYKLNFETLVSPHPKPHFWIEDVCIQNASFLAVLEQPTRIRSSYSKDLLLMGAPVEASKDFPGLAHAPEEIQRVSAHFRQAKETVIKGKQATPIAYRSSDPRQFRFFHFVTHGTASDTNPLDSAIILSPSTDGYKLYARDIIKTKIHPELVTISTCYGAGTRQYSGEGLVGLAWAFMRVGAHQVVAALWEVDDAANAELMDQFYAELTKGRTAATALRDGKLAMLHSMGPRKQPYYWASLQLYTGP